MVELVQTGSMVTEENLKGSDEVEFIQVECLKYNTVALTSEGQVFSCGKGGSDGGGHGDQPHTLFCLIEALKSVPIRFLSAATTSHIAAIADNNHVYIWGSGEEGKLGLGDTESLLAPQVLRSLKGRKVFTIACGETHTAAILDWNSTDDSPSDSIGEKPINVKQPAQKQQAKVETPNDEYEEYNEVVQPSNDSNIPEDYYSDADNDDEDEMPKMVTPPSVISKTPAPSQPSAPTKVEPKNENKTQPTTTAKTEDAAAAADRKFTDMSGYMNKKGEKGLIKLWKKRFFKMERDTIDYYVRLERVY